MKFKLIIILSLILVMCSCGTDKSSNIDSAINEAPDGINILSKLHTYDIFDIAIGNSGNNIYIADKEHILITDRNGNKKSEIKGFQNCVRFALGNSSIYALDRTKNGDVIKELSLDGKLKQEIPASTNGSNVFKIEYSNGNLIFHHHKRDTQKKTLSIFNLKNKNMKPVDIENADAFTVYNDNSLIIGVYSGVPHSKFIIYDYEKNEIIDEIENNLIYSDLIYDKNENCLYYIDSRIYRYDLKSNETERLIDLRNYTSIAFTKIINDTDYFYLLDAKDDRIFCIGKDAVNTKHKEILTIVSVSRVSVEYELKKAEELFKKANPQCDIVYKSKGDNELKVSVMAGDNDMDIIYVENHLFNDFVGSGAVISLDGYQNIKENFTNMLDGIENLCTYNNSLVGVPVFLSIDMWEANQELLDRLNLKLPKEDWNWYDFYEYAKLSRQDINGDGINDTYIIEGKPSFPTFFQQYNSAYVDLAAGKASFNNDSFKNLLALWKKLWDEDLIAYGTRMSFKMKDNIVFSIANCFLALGDKAIACPPSLLDGQKSYPAQVYLLCINSFSQNKDLAAELLSFYCSKEAQTVIDPLTGRTFYKDISVYPPISAGAETFSNDKNIEIFKNMYKHSAREQDNVDLRCYMFGVIADYMRDGISLDKAVTLIDGKAKMIVGE